MSVAEVSHRQNPPLLLLLCVQQSESVAQEACAEFEVACSEVNLQQQLEELEALILQRGLLGDAKRCVQCCASRSSSSVCWRDAS